VPSRREGDFVVIVDISTRRRVNMASTAVSRFLLPHPAALCPPPLHLQNRTRKITHRRRILRKPTSCSQDHISHGPLDDIIAEIKNDILELPPSCTSLPFSRDWGHPLKAPSTWAVTPLPVSRAPSDQPLTIRKHRNSRSSASESSVGGSMSSSRINSQDMGTTGTTPWPLVDVPGMHGPANTLTTFDTTVHSEHGTTQRMQEDAAQRASDPPGAAGQRRPSRLRMFTQRVPLLRRRGTGETSASTDDGAESFPATTTTTSPIGQVNAPQYPQEPSDEAISAYMRRNADK
jgi:hypothetical protein